MPPTAASIPAIQQLKWGGLTDPKTGQVNDVAYRYFIDLDGLLRLLLPAINSTPGVNRFLLANQPTLGPADSGYLGFVIDFAHHVYWDGSAWQWDDELRPGNFEDYAQNPGTGYALCDGSATTFLVVGGPTLTTSAFTTPNLVGTPSYRKSAAAYTGTLNAASGSTGTGNTGTGTTGNESSHTHNVPAQNGLPTSTESSDTPPVFAITGSTATPSVSHEHTVNVPAQNTGAGSAHSHSVPALTVPALAAGSIDMPNLGVLPYVRR